MTKAQRDVLERLAQTLTHEDITGDRTMPIATCRALQRHGFVAMRMKSSAWAIRMNLPEVAIVSLTQAGRDALDRHNKDAKR